MKLLQSRYFLFFINYQDTRDFICFVVDYFSAGRYLFLFVNCWGFFVFFVLIFKVICDLFVVSEFSGCYLITFVNLEFSFIWIYVQDVVVYFKYKMVVFGGCVVKFGIVIYIINVKNFIEVKYDLDCKFYSFYFDMIFEKFDEVINFLIVIMVVY